MANVPKVNGAIGDQKKMLKVVLQNIMEGTFAAEFTWTGKTVANRKKMAFKKLKNMNELLFSIVVHIDPSYRRSEFDSHLINKVLKYAYE